MPPLQFGLVQGLSERFPESHRVEDLRYQQQQDKAANIAAANKAKMFADDFQYNNAMNTFDNPRVKAFSQAKIKEIGQFVNQNPDWETNMQKRQTYSQMIHDLKDNPELNRGLASDEANKSYLKDLAEKNKTPETFNKKGYDRVALEKANYLKYGNQDGEEAASKEGFKAFTYTQPQDYTNLNKAGLGYGNMIKDYNRKPVSGLGVGAYETEPNAQQLESVAKSMLSEHNEQITDEARKLNVDPLEYTKTLIRAGIPKQTYEGVQPKQQSEWEYKLSHPDATENDVIDKTPSSYKIMTPSAQGASLEGTVEAVQSGRLAKNLTKNLTMTTDVRDISGNTLPLQKGVYPVSGSDIKVVPVYKKGFNVKGSKTSVEGNVIPSERLDDALKNGAVEYKTLFYGSMKVPDIYEEDSKELDNSGNPIHHKGEQKTFLNSEGKETPLYKDISVTVPASNLKGGLGKSEETINQMNDYAAQKNASLGVTKTPKIEVYSEPKTQEDWDKMPVGAYYIDSQGNKITKNK